MNHEDCFDLSIPERGRGRQRKADAERYDREVRRFCREVERFRDDRLGFTPSARGWCYILEEYGLEKGAFDAMQRKLTEWRKSGLLPLDVTAEDDARAFELVERLDGDPPSEAEAWVRGLDDAPNRYASVSFWED